MKQIRKQVLSVAGMLCISLSVTAQTPAPGWFTKVNDEMDWNVPNAYTFCIADINDDNYPDILVLDIPAGENVYTVRKPFRIWLNVVDTQAGNTSGRKFIDITGQKQINAVPPDTGNHANCLTLADFNNDGHLDLVTGNFYYRIENYTLPGDRCQVFLGDGTGNFTWRADNGLQDLDLINVRSLTALDYDRDGNLDIFIAPWFEDYTGNVFDHGRLMKGNGDGTFTDVTVSGGLNNYKEPMYSAAATDWNNDGNPDILTAPYCRTGGMVLRNDGSGGFTNVASSVGYDLFRMGAGQPACTFTITPEDVNNDGYMDAFLSVVHGGNLPGQFRSTIAINKGPADNYAFDIKEDLLPVFAPASSHRGDYDGSFLDFDNDGLKDLVMTQATYMPATDRTYFWKQNTDHSFEDITHALGLVVPAMKGSSAIEPFDFDLDGDDDLVILAAGSTYFNIWQNNIGQDNNWVAVKLHPHAGTGVNRSAIGARIYVYYGGGKMQMREVMAGRGMHMGQQPFILNFGLGNVSTIDSIIVQWPDRNSTRKTVVNPPANQIVFIDNFPVDIADMPDIGRDLKVFPNPTAQYVIVQGRGVAGSIREAGIFDVTGRHTKATWSKSDGDKLIFDLGLLQDGIYLVLLEFDNGIRQSYQIIRRGE